jgi:hypothetical protein
MEHPDPPPFCRPEFVDEIHGLCLLGDLSAEEIAEALAVGVETVRAWETALPEFTEAMRRGGRVADGAAAKGLHKRATGCTHPAVRIFMPARAEEPIRADYDVHLPPHPASAIKWLEARHPRVWRNKEKIEAPITNDIEELKKRSSEELWAIVARELAKLGYRPSRDQG